MQEYFFANYRLLIDDEIAGMKSMQYLQGFRAAMSYTHTFIVHLGNPDLLDAEYEKTMSYPEACTTERFTFHDASDCWRIACEFERFDSKYAVVSSRDYSELTVYMPVNRFYSDKLKKWIDPLFPFSLVRAICEAGMVLRGGMPLHASLVEKDGCGVIFLGPSGMGKSTQAKLWVQYQNADFVIGDRPAVRCIDGVWYGFGMPWDGKDNIRTQKRVPVKALISLEQAKENQITRLNEQQAMMVLLNQVMMPLWDDEAMKHVTGMMERLAKAIPFYHLKNMPNEEAAALTYHTIFGDGD